MSILDGENTVKSLEDPYHMNFGQQTSNQCCAYLLASRIRVARTETTLFPKCQSKEECRGLNIRGPWTRSLNHDLAKTASVMIPDVGKFSPKRFVPCMETNGNKRDIMHLPMQLSRWHDSIAFSSSRWKQPCPGPECGQTEFSESPHLARIITSGRSTKAARLRSNTVRRLHTLLKS